MRVREKVRALGGWRAVECVFSSLSLSLAQQTHLALGFGRHGWRGDRPAGGCSPVCDSENGRCKVPRPRLKRREREQQFGQRCPSAAPLSLLSASPSLSVLSAVPPGSHGPRFFSPASARPVLFAVSFTDSPLASLTTVRRPTFSGIISSCRIACAKKKKTPLSLSLSHPTMVDTRCANRVMTGASVGGALGASIGECGQSERQWEAGPCPALSTPRSLTSLASPARVHKARSTAPTRPSATRCRASTRSGMWARPRSPRRRFSACS